MKRCAPGSSSRRRRTGSRSSGSTDAPEMPPRYNIAPDPGCSRRPPPPHGGRARRDCSDGASFRAGPKTRRPATRLINARAESVATRAAFRDPFKQRRCLVPAQGFYEWKKFGRAREPWLIRLKGGADLRVRGSLGPLGGRGQHDRVLRAHHHRRQRAGGAHPRTHARAARPRRLRSAGSIPTPTEADLRALLAPFSGRGHGGVSRSPRA